MRNLTVIEKTIQGLQERVDFFKEGISKNLLPESILEDVESDVKNIIKLLTELVEYEKSQLIAFHVGATRLGLEGENGLEWGDKIERITISMALDFYKQTFEEKAK